MPKSFLGIEFLGESGELKPATRFHEDRRSFKGVVAGLDDYRMLQVLKHSNCLPNSNKDERIRGFDQLTRFGYSRETAALWRKYVSGWHRPREMFEGGSIRVSRVGPFFGLYRMHKDRWRASLYENELPDSKEDFHTFDLPEPLQKFFSVGLDLMPLAGGGEAGLLLALIIYLPFIIVGLVVALAMFAVLFIPMVIFFLSIGLLLSLNLISMGRLNRHLMLWRIKLSATTDERIQRLARSCISKGGILSSRWEPLMTPEDRQLHALMKEKQFRFTKILKVVLYSSLVISLMFPIQWYFELEWMVPFLVGLMVVCAVGFVISWVLLIHGPQRGLVKEG